MPNNQKEIIEEEEYSEMAGTVMDCLKDISSGSINGFTVSKLSSNRGKTNAKPFWEKK